MTVWSKRSTLAVVLAAMLTGLVGCESSEPAALGNANVLWVTICTLRADHLGTYGYPLQTSPEIDALAERGVVFETARSQAPWTRASIASMLTGRYPRAIAIEERGKHRKHRGLLASFTTLAERFSKAGYKTIGITANPNANAVFRFNQGFDFYRDTGQSWEQGYAENLMSADDVTATLLTQIGELSAGEKFFASLIFVDAHGPYPRAREALTRTKGFRGTGKTALYDAHIRYVDLVLGELHRKLAEIGRSDTLIVLTSDHGQGFGAKNTHDIGHGNFLYDTTLRVPLILHHPKLVASAKRISSNVEVMDAVPTVLDLTGIAYEPGSFDGRSLAAAVLGTGELPPPRDRFAETAFGYGLKSSILADGWKLIVDYGDVRAPTGAPRVELYDLANDPAETENRIDDEKPRAEELFRRLAAWQAEVDKRAPKEPLTVDPSGAEQDALRSLGYLGGN